MTKYHVEVLIAKLTDLRTKNKKYSLRAYAKKIGISHSFLVEILKEKKCLSIERGRIVSKKLLLSPGEQDLFIKSLKK